jgi:hypothetical protein
VFAEEGSYGKSYLGGLEASGGYLVQERLEQMIVITVYQRDPHPWFAGKLAHRV